MLGLHSQFPVTMCPLSRPLLSKAISLSLFSVDAWQVHAVQEHVLLCSVKFWPHAMMNTGPQLLVCLSVIGHWGGLFVNWSHPHTKVSVNPFLLIILAIHTVIFVYGLLKFCQRKHGTPTWWIIAEQMFGWVYVWPPPPSLFLTSSEPHLVWVRRGSAWTWSCTSPLACPRSVREGERWREH